MDIENVCPTFAPEEDALSSKLVPYINIFGKIIQNKGQSVLLLSWCVETGDTHGELSPYDMEIGRIVQGKYHFYPLDVDIVF